MRSIEESVLTDHGFLPDLTSSTHKNAIRVLGDTPPGYYFNSPSNLAFHDLTEGRVLPPTTHIVMGLSNKFIPTPPLTTERVVAIEAFERLDRDLSLKVHFAGDAISYLSKSKLYVKSTFRPSQPPLKVNSRLQAFEKELQKVFFSEKREIKFHKVPVQALRESLSE